jgi:hypothetical protein
MSKKPSRTDFDPFDDVPLGDPFDDPFDAAPYPPPDAPDDAAITAALEKLAAIDLAALFGPDGALAGELAMSCGRASSTWPKQSSAPSSPASTR